MERKDWKNLNGPLLIKRRKQVCKFLESDNIDIAGIWELAIVAPTDPIPSVFPQSIMVPFCVESALSGVVFAAVKIRFQQTTLPGDDLSPKKPSAGVPSHLPTSPMGQTETDSPPLSGS